VGKPVSAQELIDWINSYCKRGEVDIHEAESILIACRAFLEALEESK